jgi:hypothetical protein
MYTTVMAFQKSSAVVQDTSEPESVPEPEPDPDEPEDLDLDLDRDRDPDELDPELL